MNVTIIHKGNKNTSSVKDHLKNIEDCIVQEISLYEGSLDLLMYESSDIIIFDSIVWKGEHTDIYLLEEIRQRLPHVPVVLATNATEQASYRESMLDAGVDGCIQIPYLPEELYIRMTKLVTKKSPLLFSGTIIETNDVKIDIRNHLVTQGHKLVTLTKTEYSILLHLFLHKNILVSTDELSTCLKDAGEHSLALGIHIFNLRRKIKIPSLIKTIPSYGFTISDKHARM